MVERFAGGGSDPHYLAYFDLFNRGLFYEAHDVLEQIWLPQRKEPKGDFYKGLIQLAGAFVHLQKNRLRPAAALFKLAQANLEKYGDTYEGVSLSEARALIGRYLDFLISGGYEANPPSSLGAPRLQDHRTTRPRDQ